MSAFLNLIPRWALFAAIMALIALSGWLGWSLIGVQSDLLTSKSELSTANTRIAELELAIERANTKAAEEATALRNQVIEAQNDAKKREIALRAAAAAAASESDGLRDDLATMRVQLQQSTRDAAIERALALGDVLKQCAARHQDLAQRCDRHVNDIQTLIDAWPKAPEFRHNTN